MGLLLVALAVTAGIWWLSAGRSDKEERGLRPVRVEEVREIVRLSTLEIDEEIAVKGHVGPRHLVARQRLTGSVDFDLQQLRMREVGDTLYVSLPPARITLRESTEPGSYTVIDEWNDKLFGSNKMTAREENEIKRKTLEYARRDLKRKGYAERARRDAAANLVRLLGTTTGRTVIIEN